MKVTVPVRSPASDVRLNEATAAASRRIFFMGIMFATAATVAAPAAGRKLRPAGFTGADAGIDAG